MAGRFEFKSVGAAAGDALKRHLVQQEIARRERVMFDLGLQDRALQQARQDMLDAQEVERYNTRRQDQLMERADNQGQKYLDAELRRNEREYDQRQRSMERADANATRYQDAELRRQEADEQRDYQHRENELQRGNARAIAGMQQGGRSGDKRTEGQRKTEGLLSRARAARSTADQLESSVSTVDLLAPSFLRSEKGQQYRQSAKQWIQSVLRDESGAAIGADEEASYFETYFRQPGDTPAVIRQKQQARDAAEDAMQQKAGGGGGGSNSSTDGGWRDHGKGVRVRRKN
jgi:hypothetical protein